MTTSQTAGWTLDSPTPAQLKEFFAQIGSGRVTKERLQGFLRGGAFGGIVDGDWFTYETSGKSVLDLLWENPDIGITEHAWARERWAQDHDERGGRISMRTLAVPGSFEKTWSEQLGLLGPGEFVLSPRDLLEGAISYQRATGKKLWTQCWVRTSGIALNGDRILFGNFGPRRFSAMTDWDNYRGSDLGLSAGRDA